MVNDLRICEKKTEIEISTYAQDNIKSLFL